MCFLRCPSRRVSWDAPQAAFCWGLRGGLQVSKFFVASCVRSASRRVHLAIVEVFLVMSEGLEAIFFLSFSFLLVGSVGDVSRVLLACVLHALGTNPAAVRGFRNRFPKPNFEMMSARFQTSVPGYSRIVSCDVGRPVFFPFLSF